MKTYKIIEFKQMKSKIFKDLYRYLKLKGWRNDEEMFIKKIDEKTFHVIAKCNDVTECKLVKLTEKEKNELNSEVEKNV